MYHVVSFEAYGDLVLTDKMNKWFDVCARHCKVIDTSIIYNPYDEKVHAYITYEYEVNR